jgi:hypothetical protein
MSEMNRDEWIEKASQYAEKHRTKPIHVLMADFAIEAVTLNGWREIKSEDDLPKERGQYDITVDFHDGKPFVESVWFEPEGARFRYGPNTIAWRERPAPFVKEGDK